MQEKKITWGTSFCRKNIIIIIIIIMCWRREIYILFRAIQKARALCPLIFPSTVARAAKRRSTERGEVAGNSNVREEEEILTLPPSIHFSSSVVNRARKGPRGPPLLSFNSKISSSNAVFI